MKNLFAFSFLLLITINLACNLSAEQTSLAKQNQTSTPTPPVEKLDEPTESYLPENEDIVNRSGDIKTVLMGYLTIKDMKIISENDWALGEDKDEDTLKEGMIFDVLTCAGFVAKAKLKKWHGENESSDKGYNWEVEFIGGKTTKLFESLLNKCSTGGDKQIRAFAVYPSKPEREKIQILKTPDLNKVFASISERDKKWIASDDPENTGYLEEKKKMPDIEFWTDADGDEQIDLIEVKGNCNGQPDGDLTCSQILHFSGGKWIRVGWLATD